VTNRPPGPEEGVHRDRPEGDDHAQGGEESHLALEIRLAVAELRRRGSVPRWSTSHCGGNVAIAQPEAVGLRDRGGLIRESVPVEGPKQPLAAPISREDAAGSISSVGRRGKADDEEPGAGPRGMTRSSWHLSAPGSLGRLPSPSARTAGSSSRSGSADASRFSGTRRSWTRLSLPFRKSPPRANKDSSASRSIRTFRTVPTCTYTIPWTMRRMGPSTIGSSDFATTGPS